MTELDQPIVVELPVMRHIEAIKALSPISMSNQMLTWNKSAYWNHSRGDSLPHHQALFGAYAAFVERDTLGQITPSEIQNTETLIRWATGIYPRPDHCIADDPVRGKGMRGIFEYRLENMQALHGDEATNHILAAYRILMRSMVDTRWLLLPDAQVMDERLGRLRACSVAENMKLLENRIRRNAQELLNT